GSLDISMSSGDTVYMEIEGTAIRVGKIGGAEESTTDASYATGTFVGMYSQTAVVTLDDWSAEDLGGGGPILMPRAIHVAG
ncbi:MAG: hypothetical protein ACRD0W_25130, partial [Acidimicrobiales bacterium]